MIIIIRLTVMTMLIGVAESSHLLVQLLGRLVEYDGHAMLRDAK